MYVPGLILIWNAICFFVICTACRKHPKRQVLLVFGFFLVAPVAAIAALIVLNVKWGREAKAIQDSLLHNPSDKEVDAFIELMDKHGFKNEPNVWHQIRGVWYSVNKSPNTTTAKKEELKTFLLVNGLYLNREEKQVIDNYGK